MKTASAGSKESSDCLITVKKASEVIIEIRSVVDVLYHEQIESVIKKTLNDMDADDVHVLCEDRGALDYTIKARLLTALERLGNDG